MITAALLWLSAILIIVNLLVGPMLTALISTHAVLNRLGLFRAAQLERMELTGAPLPAALLYVCSTKPFGPQSHHQQTRMVCLVARLLLQSMPLSISRRNCSGAGHWRLRLSSCPSTA